MLARYGSRVRCLHVEHGGAGAGAQPRPSTRRAASTSASSIRTTCTTRTSSRCRWSTSTRTPTPSWCTRSSRRSTRAATGTNSTCAVPPLGLRAGQARLRRSCSRSAGRSQTSAVLRAARGRGRAAGTLAGAPSGYRGKMFRRLSVRHRGVHQQHDVPPLAAARASGCRIRTSGISTTWNSRCASARRARSPSSTTRPTSCVITRGR